MQIALIRAATARWAVPVERLRARIGLPPLTGNLFVDDKYSPHLVLALFSAVFAEPQADWPPGTLATGFPFYDGSDTDSGIAPALRDFLNAGPPPIVFTLGSSAVMTPGRFFDESLATARQMGRRAVLLVGSNPPPQNLGPDCLALDYAPYSALFPRACAIVHQGGIGTTGQALRAGRPTLIMPYSLDQPDNAARAARLGTSLTISRRRYQALHVTRLLTELVEQPGYTQRAEAVGRAIQADDAVRVACDAIERRLSNCVVAPTLQN
jgi:UDP:flavonoid glycosyltransferase YjiC (YdhE family)